jgi:TolA-binding protein
LFKIGEHYFKAGDFSKANYVFKKYLEYYPETDYGKIAMERIKTINSGGPVKSKAAADDFEDFSMEHDSSDVFSFDEVPSGSKKLPDKGDINPAASSALSSEMDDFLADESDSIDDFGDFGLEEESKPKDTIKIKFEDGESAFKKGNFKGALEIFNEIIDSGLPSSDRDRHYFIDAHFYAGVCYYEMKKYKESMNLLAEIIKTGVIQKSIKALYSMQLKSLRQQARRIKPLLIITECLIFNPQIH